MHKTLSVVVIFVLAGCSGMATPSAPSLAGLAPGGAAPGTFSVPHLAELASLASGGRSLKATQDLYVSDFATGNVEVLQNAGYQKIGMIKNGLGSPDGDYLDAKGNLYVANYGGRTITEYPPGQKMPSFTYSSGMQAPVNVTVDAKGNVYESDFKGFVNEYAQNSNVAEYTCTPGGGVEGVAINKHGDVFVSYNPRFGPAKIVEYKNTLSGCHNTLLDPGFKFIGGIQFDRHDNLLVCDQSGPAVDVLEPPYTSITSTLGGNYQEPFHITLSRDNKVAYVADPHTPAVYVLKYPSGEPIATLGMANGVSQPAGAVDAPNAVY
ncbi:MAG TPA: hypothetical protein VGX91_06270 [Candidatus Cybelea sp.]|jgi:sugar lactone lactonase YvrE|nr:hypothetical protein [Candidatus Cybelea sp.]